VNQYLGLDRNVGLTTALLGEAAVDDLLHKWGDDELYVLTSGRIPPNPSELLGSHEMQQLIMTLENAFDVVLLDTPPVLPVTDATVLAQHVGGVILVVGAHRIKRNELDRSLQALGLVKAEVLGVIMNRIPQKGADAYSYSYSTPTTADTRPSRNSSRGARPLAKLHASMDDTPNSADFVDRAASPSAIYPRERIRRSNIS
jgi:capsular exopolysaccharide synthesis family protein